MTLLKYDSGAGSGAARGQLGGTLGKHHSEDDDTEEHPNNEDVLDNLGLVDFRIPTPTYRNIQISYHCTQTVGTVESRPGILARA